MRSGLLLLAGLIVGFAVGMPARAGLYNPAEEPKFEVDAQGVVQPLPYQFFAMRYPELLALRKDDPNYAPRAEILKRIRTTKAKGVESLSPEELAGLTADLIRVGKADEALNLLAPISRERGRAGFLVLTSLAEAHEARGEWLEAYQAENSAVNDYDFPKSFPNYGPELLTWCRKVERQFYLPLLRSRMREAQVRRFGVPETVDALFPPPGAKGPSEPVRYVGASEHFEAGTIAAAEKAKLPADALAVVQQLLLWNPEDTRLYWQLGELYNARGDVATADKIFHDCVYNRGYSAPALVEHRRIVGEALAARAAREVADRAALEAQDAAAQQSAKEKWWRQFWVVMAVAVPLVLLFGYWQVRELARRFR